MIEIILESFELVLNINKLLHDFGRSLLILKGVRAAAIEKAIVLLESFRWMWLVRQRDMFYRRWFLVDALSLAVTLWMVARQWAPLNGCRFVEIQVRLNWKRSKALKVVWRSLTEPSGILLVLLWQKHALLAGNVLCLFNFDHAQILFGLLFTFVNGCA